MMMIATLYQQNWWNWYRYIFKIMIERLSMNSLVKSIDLSIFFKNNCFPGGIRGSERHIWSEQIQRPK